METIQDLGLSRNKIENRKLWECKEINFGLIYYINFGHTPTKHALNIVLCAKQINAPDHE